MIFAHGSIVHHAITFFLDMPLSALKRVKNFSASASALQVKNSTACLGILNRLYSSNWRGEGKLDLEVRRLIECVQGKSPQYLRFKVFL